MTTNNLKIMYCSSSSLFFGKGSNQLLSVEKPNYPSKLDPPQQPFHTPFHTSHSFPLSRYSMPTALHCTARPPFLATLKNVHCRRLTLEHPINIGLVCVFLLQLSQPASVMADMDPSSTSGRDHGKSKEYRRQVTKLEFSEDEEILIARMFNLVGERWSLIAGRIPGRTAEEIEKYWRSKTQ